MLSYSLSFFAGTLTAVSPCVLPALPLIVGSAVQEHRHSPLAVAAGMILSFTILGMFFATAGLTLGMDEQAVRSFAAGTLILFGSMLVIPAFQNQIQALLTPLASAAGQRLATGKFKGLSGQFALGWLLGAVWSPCIGPALGAAIGLATQSGGFWPATVMMLLFGVGSAVPLLFIAYGSRRTLQLRRNRLLIIRRIAKPALGTALTITGIAILWGLDKKAETYLLNLMPTAWTDLITRF